jgi:hypothetical protein
MGLLLKYSGNWGDEMTLHGFYAMTGEREKKFREVYELVKNERFGFYCGSNQETHYSLAGNFEVVDISDEEFSVIMKLFDPYKRPGKEYIEYGKVPYLLDDVSGHLYSLDKIKYDCWF